MAKNPTEILSPVDEKIEETVGVTLEQTPDVNNMQARPTEVVEEPMLEAEVESEEAMREEYVVASGVGKPFESLLKKGKGKVNPEKQDLDTELIDQQNIKLNEDADKLRKEEIEGFLSPVYFDDATGKVRIKGVNANVAKQIEDSFLLLQEDQLPLLTGALNDLLRNQSDIPFDVANFSDVVGQFTRSTKKRSLEELEQLASNIGREDLYLLVKEVGETKTVLNEEAWIRGAWETILIDAYSAPLQEKIIRRTATKEEQLNYYRSVSQSMLIRNTLEETLSSGATVMRYSQTGGPYIKNLSLNLNERRNEIEGYFTRGEIDLHTFALMMNDLSPAQQSVFKKELSESIGIVDLAKKGYRNFMDLTAELYINSKLSSPLTHISNIVGNTLYNTYRFVEYAVAAGVNKAYGITDEDAIQFNEVLEMFFGFRDALSLGTKNAKQAFITGKPIDGFDKIELKRTHTISRDRLGKYKDTPLGSLVEGLGFASRMPTNLLTSEDEFFKGVLYHMELRRLSRKAYNRALKAGSTPEEADRLMATMLARPSKEMREEAQRLAREGTFTGEIPSDWAKKTQSFFNLPEMKMFVPFYKTVMNIFFAASERIPILNFVNPQTRKALSGELGEGAKKLAQTKLVMGTAVMGGWGAFAYGARGEGDDWFITGAAPEGTEARKAFYAAGFRPYSIVSRQEDGSYKSYEYKRFDPFGQMMAISADIAYLTTRPDFDITDFPELMGATFEAIATTATDNPLVDGLTILGAMADFKGGDWDAYFRENVANVIGMPVDFFAGTYVNPYGALTNTKNQIYGENQPDYEMVMSDGEVVGWEGPEFASMSPATQTVWREFYKIWNKIKINSVFHNDEAVPSLTLWGEEMKGPEQKWYSWTRVYGSQWNDIDKAMLKYGLYLGMPEKTIHGQRLTAKEYRTYIETMNDTRINIVGLGSNLILKEAMLKLVRSQEWIDLAEGDAFKRERAHEMMKDIVRIYEGEARSEWESTKDLRVLEELKTIKRYDPDTSITFDVGQ